MSEETNNQPEKGWTCFHCGETFTNRGSARDHFGPNQTATPGCQIKINAGGELGLLVELRKAEEIIASYVNEDIDTQKAMYTMQSRHSSALEQAEILGYERGLRDRIRENYAFINLRIAAMAAANEIHENAEALKGCSTNSEGDWADEIDSKESYEKSITLVYQIRELCNA